jgi:hypothetical protein
MDRGFVTEGMKHTRTYMTDITEYKAFYPVVRIWSPHTPLPRESVAPPPSFGPQGRAHALAGEEVGGPYSDDWRKSLALCLPCDFDRLTPLFCSRLTIPFSRSPPFNVSMINIYVPSMIVLPRG